jgi:hypothetical protein
MGKKSPIGPKTDRAPFLKGRGKPLDSSPDDLPTAFSFEKMQEKSGHSVNCCQDEDREKLIQRMFMLSKLPWKNVKNAPNKGLGCEQIPKGRIKKPIPSSVTPDVDSFSSLHYQGKKRFIGYRVGRIFFILWIDHDFTVYDHG